MSEPELNAVRTPPLEGPARFLVVVCHGHGGSSVSPTTVQLVQGLQPYLPTAAFAAPDGPQAAPDGGFRWFPVDLSNRSLEQFHRGALDGAVVLDRFVDGELARLGLGPERLILTGFSQGAVTALNAGIRRPVLPVALAIFGGALVSTYDLPAGRGGPPVALLQGSEDRPEFTPAAEEALTGAGIPVQVHTLPGLGHAVDERGLALAGAFLADAAKANAPLPAGA